MPVKFWQTSVRFWFFLSYYCKDELISVDWKLIIFKVENFRTKFHVTKQHHSRSLTKFVHSKCCNLNCNSSSSFNLRSIRCIAHWGQNFCWILFQAKLLQLKLIHIFARAILLMKKLEIEKTKPSFIISVLKVEL